MSWKDVNKTRVLCIHCSNGFAPGQIKRHQNSCIENPINKKECPACGKMHSKKAITCSYACSNRYFRSGRNNPNWKDETYRTTCFEKHEKKCVVCGEDKIVAVHHMNENKKDNSLLNLVPLCPTHHQYIHSRYKDEVLPIIEEYLSRCRLAWYGTSFGARNNAGSNPVT